MIESIANKCTQDIYDGVNSKQARKIPRDLHSKSRRLLDQINAAPSIDLLRIPPSNRLEKLKGDLSDYWSLRINDQWRIIFQWENGNALNVEIVDYHR